MKKNQKLTTPGLPQISYFCGKFKKYINQLNPMVKNKSAFTLVELIIVITILAILTTIAFISFQGYTKNARDSNRTSTLANLQKGLDIYSVQVGTLPEPEGTILSGTLNGIQLNRLGIIGDNISKLVKLNKTPTDPVSGNNYVYGISADNKSYQIGITLENLESYNGITQNTYADNGSFKAKVVGNYKYPLKYNGKLYSLPSLLFTGTGGDLSQTGNAYFIVDKGLNVPYTPDKTTLNNTQSTTQVLQSITGTGGLSLTGIDISSVNPSDIKNGVGQTNNLLSALGITDNNVLGNAIFGNNYSTNTITNSVPAYVSGTPYTKGQSFTFDSITWYVSNNTKVAYTRSSGSNEFPLDLTSSDLILVFENGNALTKGTNAFILKTVNQGATTPYIYGTVYSGTPARLWGAEPTISIYGANTTERQAIYTADKSMLGDYYQWGRNNPVSLTGTTTSLYNTTGYQTGGVNLSTDYGFIINPSSPNSWLGTYHNTSSSVIWTDSNNPGPCDNGYKLPTTSTTIGSGEWRRVVEIVTGVTASWSTTERQTLQKYLLLPMVGNRSYLIGDFNNHGSLGFYWSSSSTGGNGHILSFDYTSINPSNSHLRAIGFVVRCFKN